MTTIVQDEYAYDILDKYLSMEMSGMLANEKLLSNQDDVTVKFRAVVCNWIFSTVRLHKLSIKTYHLSVTYFDILLQRKSILKNGLLKYGAMCLSLASKMNEISTPELEEYFILSNYKYTKEELEQTEREVYDILNHKLIVPTLYNFTEVYINLLKRDDSFAWSTKEQHLTDGIISFVYMFTTKTLKYLPSLISLSCIIVSKEYFDKENHEDLINDYFLNYSFTFDDLLFGYSFVRKIMNLYNTEKSEDVKSYLNVKIKNNDFSDYFSEEYKIVDIDTKDLIRPKHNYTPKRIISDKDVNKIKKIGRGAYSSVYKVKIGDDTKAFKNMVCETHNDGIDYTILRELSILNYVSHSNLLDLESSTYDSAKNCYGVIFEFMEKDLYSIIDNLSDYQIKRYSTQLLQSVEYLHSNGILHRDIKPKNILIKGNDIKLADYGVSRSMIVENGKYTTSTFTISYKPIELLLGIKEYSFAVDIWQCAVVISEIIKQNDLIGGSSEIDVIHSILLVFGSKKVKEVYSDISNFNFRNFNGSGLKSVLKTDDDLVVDLLEYMFEIDYTKRPTAKMVLNHSWFIL